MKKFIIKIALSIVLPLLILFITGEIILRSIPNNYSYKNDYLEKNSSSIKILALGSSHTFSGINPKYFSSKAFNAAESSQSFKYDYWILSKFIHKMDSLEYVIIPISYFSPVMTMESGYSNSFVKNYCIYYNCPFHKFEPEYNFEMWGFGPPTLDKIKSLFKEKDKSLVCDKLGYGMRYNSKTRKADWYTRGKSRAKEHTVDTINHAILNESYDYLRKMISLCKEKNIKVILLTTPAYKTYTDNLNPSQVKIMEEMGNKFSKENKNTIYLNLLTSPKFNQSDFFNTDHLSEIGAKKLTLMLNDTIKALSIK